MQIKSETILEVLDKNNQLIGNPLNFDGLIFDDVQYNSSKVNKKNTLFIVKGNIKEEYIKQAILNGATVIVTEKKHQVDAPQIIIQNAQISLAVISKTWFGKPDEKIRIIGITGTKGKTSAAYILYSILSKTVGAKKTALFSTIDTIISDRLKEKSKLTTPESYDLFANIKTALDDGVEYLVMEVSSQAYLLNRVYGINFEVGMFLNISDDHIGENEHPNFQDYLEKKSMLAENSNRMLINSDDKFANQFAGRAETDILIGRSDYSIIEKNLKHSVFTFENKEYELSIPGDYNIQNAVFALKAIKLLDINFEDKLIPIKNIPGRMLQVKVPNKGLVFVDYAHNYDSLHRLMLFLKEQIRPTGRIIIVVGSTGNKGQSRRKGFGKAIDEFADIAILTSDDPGFENPENIANDIKTEIKNPKINVEYIEDRKLAILKAIEISKPEDLVVLAAKGEDTYQKINGIDTPYEGDFQIANEIAEAQ